MFCTSCLRACYNTHSTNKEQLKWAKMCIRDSSTISPKSACKVLQILLRIVRLTSSSRRSFVLSLIHISVLVEAHHPMFFPAFLTKLFFSFFWGRTDVYAKRNVNKNGEAAYYPQCDNFWSDNCHRKLNTPVSYTHLSVCNESSNTFRFSDL